MSELQALQQVALNNPRPTPGEVPDTKHGYVEEDTYTLVTIERVEGRWFWHVSISIKDGTFPKPLNEWEQEDADRSKSIAATALDGVGDGNELLVLPGVLCVHFYRELSDIEKETVDQKVKDETVPTGSSE